VVFREGEYPFTEFQWKLVRLSVRTEIYSYQMSRSTRRESGSREESVTLPNSGFKTNTPNSGLKQNAPNSGTLSQCKTNCGSAKNNYQQSSCPEDERNDIVAEFRSTTTTLNHGETSHNTSTSGVNNNNAVDSETGISPSIQSFLVKQTELMNQMMQHLHNNASGSQLVNKPSTAYDDESDQSSHGGNSSDEDDWTHSLDRITKMMRTPILGF
jgi:hypothetical protein